MYTRQAKPVPTIKTHPDKGEVLTSEQIITPEEREIIKSMIARLYSYSEWTLRHFWDQFEGPSGDENKLFNHYSSENIEAVVWETIIEQGNYKDEVWSELSVMTVEKITYDEFERGMEQLPAEDSHYRFNNIFTKDAAQSRIWAAKRIYREKYYNGHLLKWEEKPWGDFKSDFSTYDVTWDSYGIAYLTGRKDLSGCYRIISACGNDRS